MKWSIGCWKFSCDLDFHTNSYKLSGPQAGSNLISLATVNEETERLIYGELCCSIFITLPCEMKTAEERETSCVFACVGLWAIKLIVDLFLFHEKRRKTQFVIDGL